MAEAAHVARRAYDGGHGLRAAHGVHVGALARLSYIARLYAGFAHRHTQGEKQSVCVCRKKIGR